MVYTQQVLASCKSKRSFLFIYLKLRYFETGYHSWILALKKGVTDCHVTIPMIVDENVTVVSDIRHSAKIPASYSGLFTSSLKIFRILTAAL